MRFMMLVKADKQYETGVPPPPELMAAVGALGQEMFQKGAMIDTGGLQPSSAGARVHAGGGRLSVTDGPFTETKELIGGYAIMEAPSLADAIALGRRFMQAHVDVLGPAYEGQLEVRPMMQMPCAATR